VAYINKFQFGLLNVFAIQAAQPGFDYALLMLRGAQQNTAPTIVGLGRQPAVMPPQDSHTAVVNAIQDRARGGGNLGNLVVFTTYIPTVACLGIMKTHGIHSVTYWNGHQLRYIAIGATPNVNNMLAAAAAAPATNNDRFYVPNGLEPVAGDWANLPNSAQAYLTNLSQAGNLPAHAHAWRANWNALPVAAGRRHMAPLQQFPGAGANATQAYADILYMLLVYAIAGRINWGGIRPSARIVGLLAEPNGRIWGWQVNARAYNTTYHAETNLVQGLRRAVPAGATLYSTLEPCHQCAGIFVHAGGQRCVFGQFDPNMTGNTALAANAMNPLGLSQRFNQATYFAQGRAPAVIAGDHLEFIRQRTAIGARAAAVGQAFQGNAHVALLPGQTRVRLAVQSINEAAIQRRVLDILETAPARELFSQSERMLGHFITVGRALWGPLAPAVSSVEQVLAQLSPARH
jgi:tRNA(Arg) A34 adenosine deaminase TadA